MRSTSPEMTKEWGARFARMLARGSVVALEGELGSGKTCFVQGMAEGLDVAPHTFVRSPSFTLLNQYDTVIPLYHLDFYRLGRPGDTDDLALDELFEGEGITVIEWADRFPQVFPANTIHISFAVIDDHTRSIDIPEPYAAACRDTSRGEIREACR